MISAGCARFIVAVVLVIAIVAVLGPTLLFMSIQRAYPGMEAVAAPVQWTSREVVLSDERPAVRGRLTLTANARPLGNLRVGLNAGVPSTGVKASPPASSAASAWHSLEPVLLSGPLVRLTAALASGPLQGCFAPCELQLASTIPCSSEACRIDFDVVVELVPEGIRRSVVTVTVAGGATAPLDERLPDSLVVDLALESTSTPRSS